MFQKNDKGIPGQLGKEFCGGKERYPDHPLYRVLHDEPNPEMTSFLFRETLQAHLLTWGNAYAEIERDSANRVVALWPLTPDRVVPARDANGRAFYRVAQPSGGEVKISAANMLHFPGLGFDGLVGYSGIAKARESIGLGLATERFGGTFFGGGSTFGISPHVVTPPAAAAWETVKKSSLCV